MPVDVVIVDAATQRWYSPTTGHFYPDTPPPPDTPVFGPVLYSRGEIDSFTTDSNYTALAGSYVGNTAWTPTAFGTALTSSTEMQAFHEEALRAKGIACLWAADGNATRLGQVEAYLDAIKGLTTIEGANGNIFQDRLELAWAACNFLPAAWIIGYEDATFDSFLDNVCWPLRDWGTGFNYHATSAAMQLMLASYRGSETKWNDAIDYLLGRVRHGVYHSTYDDTDVNPLYGFIYLPSSNPFTGTPSSNATADHWWRSRTGFTYTASYLGDAYPDGTDAEALRDLSHSVMGMVGYVYALLTIERVGVTVDDEVAVRVRACIEFVASRVREYFDTGDVAELVPEHTSGLVGGAVNYLHGWNATARWCQDKVGGVPADVTAILGESAVQTINAGLCHQGIDRYADGSLV